jgi:hypothetical protein
MAKGMRSFLGKKRVVTKSPNYFAIQKCVSLGLFALLH